MKKTSVSVRPAFARRSGTTALFATAVLVACAAQQALAVSPDVVISQVYSAGGNSGALWKNDFVELFNRGTVDRSLYGWSLQYASATGNSWNNKVDFPPDAVVRAGGYYLVKLSGGTNGADLPAADCTGSISMAAASGKIALVRTTEQLTTATPLSDPVDGPKVEDMVGYGSVNTGGAEGTPTATLSTTKAAIRNGNGCTDTDNNASDFTVAAPTTIRNSGTPAAICSISPRSLGGSGEAVPGRVSASESATLSVTVQPADTPPSTGITVTGDLSTAGGDPEQAFTVSATNPYVFTTTLTVGCIVGGKSFPITIEDAQGNSATTRIALLTTAATTAITLNPSDAIICQGGTAVFAVKTQGVGLTYTWYNAAGPITLDSRITTATSTDGTSNALRIANVTAADVSAGPYHVLVQGTCGDPVTSTNANILTTGVPATPEQKQVVISQVYGGGGNSGATLKNDYIELFNRGTTEVIMTNWSVQYASIDSGSGPEFDTPPRFTIVNGTIQPGHYFLIKESAGAGGSVDLPAPDVDGVARPEGPIFIGSQGGKFALVNNPTPLAGVCPGGGTVPSSCGLVDFVAWSSDPVSCAEGTPAYGTSNTSAIIRRSACTDTDDNSADFFVGTPNPHNSASPAYPVINTQPTNQTACLGRKAIFTVAAEGPCLEYQWQVAPGGTTDFVNVTTGTGANTATYTTGNLTAEDDGKLFRVVLTDPFWGSPVESGGATLTVTSPGPTPEEKQVVISQIYGSGGLTGATYKNDFIELFNRGTTSVDLNGWSVQYAADDGVSWSNKVNLTGIAYPGRYYVIQLKAGTSGADLPWPADQTNDTIDISSRAGKIALVHATGALTSYACASTCAVVDFVGYGSTAVCFEGSGPAPYADPVAEPTKGVVRKSGYVDTDDNAADFQIAVAAPRRLVVDYTNDGKVGQADLDLFIPCVTGPEVAIVNPACGDKDLDGDLDVDQDDFGIFQRCFSGNELVNPACMFGQ